MAIAYISMWSVFEITLQWVGVMCLGVRSVRVLKTFLPKLFYFRYLNSLTPLTPKHLNTSFFNATLFSERCTRVGLCHNKQKRPHYVEG